MQEQLISFGDFLEYKSLPASLESDASIATAVLNAQRKNLRDLLGLPLYTAMLANRASQIYADLLNGTDYVNSNGDTVHFNGVKPCLVWWAYAEFIREARMATTKSGAKVNSAPEAETPGKEEFTEEVQNALSNASMYASEAADFLAYKATTYPLYAGSDALPQVGMRLASIKQPPFNYRYR